MFSRSARHLVSRRICFCWISINSFWDQKNIYHFWNIRIERILQS
jgi:hypothetical protein